MSRCGTNEKHCCWINGEICRYLERSQDTSEFLWKCGLRSKVDSWQQVYQMSEYVENVKPGLEKAGIPVDCGDWPPPGKKCNDCGEVG